MRNAEDRELALECLQLANSTADSQLDPQAVVVRAQAYFDFVVGGTEAANAAPGEAVR